MRTLTQLTSRDNDVTHLRLLSIRARLRSMGGNRLRLWYKLHCWHFHFLKNFHHVDGLLNRIAKGEWLYCNSETSAAARRPEAATTRKLRRGSK